MTAFAEYKAACSDTWRAYTQHPFVKRLGAGTLPRASFEHYLKQDYLFLLHFARAYGLAVFKAHTLEEMRHAKDALQAILDVEIGLHIKYCARWGIDEDTLLHEPEAGANLAYTRYVLERGMTGNLTDLHAALTPCVVGYAEIGRNLAAARAPDNPYQDWIDMYASEDYQAVARAQIARLDALSAAEPGVARQRQLRETSARPTRLEVDFWDMALREAH